MRLFPSTAKSPLYAHFTESLNGLPTIRAFDGAVERFVLTNMKKVDNANAAELYLNTAQRWMAFR
jgi:ATP-binding cassette, subfamily C (CFTR/MRP), member 1